MGNMPKIFDFVIIRGTFVPELKPQKKKTNMKKFLTLAVVLTSFALASCTKEKTPNPVSTTPYDINVEYRVFGESGHLNINYNIPANGQMTTPSMLVDRTNYSVAFTWKSGQPLSISASNATPSGKEVKVEIYVNGALYQTGLANSPNAIATAAGRF